MGLLLVESLPTRGRAVLLGAEARPGEVAVVPPLGDAEPRVAAAVTAAPTAVCSEVVGDDANGRALALRAGQPAVTTPT